MSTRIQLRRDTAANWTSNNPTLAEGELGLELDTNKFKIGNGLDDWDTLNYSTTPQSINFSQSGSLSTTTGTYRWYNDSGTTLTILSVRASVAVAPTGDPVIVDVNVNGNSIYSSSANQPTIDIDEYTDLDGSKSTSTITNGQYFTIDIDQVGSSEPGQDLTVSIWLASV